MGRELCQMRKNLTEVEGACKTDIFLQMFYVDGFGGNFIITWRMAVTKQN